jgi:hypothetical protein
LRAEAERETFSGGKFVPAEMSRTTPKMPSDRPDEAVLRYVRELAKRLAREDHEAEIAAREALNPAIEQKP